MDDEKIDRALNYHKSIKQEIVDFVRKSKNLNAYMIISKGEELSEIESKISALEVAKNN